MQQCSVDPFIVYGHLLQVELVMKIFGGGEMERKIMEKSGCLNYASTTWESKKPGIYERRVSYKYNHTVSVFGGGVTCSQQKSTAPNDEGWILNDIVALHDVPFGDNFRVTLLLLLPLVFITSLTS